MSKSAQYLKGALAIPQAVSILARGGLVALPTETVYGLAADATQGAAVAAIYAAKDRPQFNPLIVHVADADAALNLIHVPDWARSLTQLWPGPLTLVARTQPDTGIADLVRAGLDTLAVRVPQAPLAQQVLRAFPAGLAAPSANPSGQVSPTTAAHVLSGLADRIDAVLDGGPCRVGVESTIISIDGEVPRLLRPGGVAAEDIAALLDRPLEQATPGITAPGQLASHYAPKAPVRLNATQAQDDEILIGFGPIAGDISLSPTGDLQQAASQVFGILHRWGGLGRPLAFAPIPQTGLGVAINDRLERAAAPRV